MEYIHYGSTWYDQSKFKKIENRDWIKPNGGLWASSVAAKMGWKEWCEGEDFRDCTKDNSFTFTLDKDANIFSVRKVGDLEQLPKIDVFNRSSMTYLDFEKIVEMGIDAIELFLDETGELYFSLYGWDCDCILVLNKDIIISQ